MGLWMKKLLENIQNHQLFAGSLTWEGVLDGNRKKRLDDIKQFVDIPKERILHSDPPADGVHTRILKDETLQGYYLQDYKTGKIERFVIIGVQKTDHADHGSGIEQFCSALIFKQSNNGDQTNVKGAFYQVVEANDLKKVYFFIKD